MNLKQTTIATGNNNPCKRVALASAVSCLVVMQNPVAGFADMMPITGAEISATPVFANLLDRTDIGVPLKAVSPGELLSLQQAQNSPEVQSDAPDASADDDTGDRETGNPDTGDNESDDQEAEEASPDAAVVPSPPEAAQAKALTNINDITPPEIERDLSKLPFPVRKMRDLLLEAAKSGDIEKLRPLVGEGDDQTMLSLGGLEGDPIEHLRNSSGDEEGYELLAILSEVLESGYVVLDKGSEQERYVWPYFFAWPLDKLTPEQKVELFRLVTYGDYQDMEEFGAYIFYRIGITPQGRWSFFVSGD